MNLSDIQPGDVLMKTVDWGNKICIVKSILTNRPKNPIQYQNAGKLEAATYIGAPEDFAKKLGTVDLDAMKAEDGAENRIAGANTNDFNALGGKGVIAAQDILKTIKPNDPIKIVRLRSGKTEDWTFVRNLPRGRKFVFVAKNRNGTSYKFPLEQIAT